MFYEQKSHSNQEEQRQHQTHACDWLTVSMLSIKHDELKTNKQINRNNHMLLITNTQPDNNQSKNSRETQNLQWTAVEMQPCIAKLSHTHTHTSHNATHTQLSIFQDTLGQLRCEMGTSERERLSPRSSVPPRWSRGDAHAPSLHPHSSQTSQNQNPGARRR